MATSTPTKRRPPPALGEYRGPGVGHRQHYYYYHLFKFKAPEFRCLGSSQKVPGGGGSKLSNDPVYNLVWWGGSLGTPVALPGACQPPLVFDISFFSVGCLKPETHSTQPLPFLIEYRILINGRTQHTKPDLVPSLPPPDSSTAAGTKHPGPVAVVTGCLRPYAPRPPVKVNAPSAGEEGGSNELTEDEHGGTFFVSYHPITSRFRITEYKVNIKLYLVYLVACECVGIAQIHCTPPAEHLCNLCNTRVLSVVRHTKQGQHPAHYHSTVTAHCHSTVTAPRHSTVTAPG